jgi:hypothetical protein
MLRRPAHGGSTATFGYRWPGGSRVATGLAVPPMTTCPTGYKAASGPSTRRRERGAHRARLHHAPQRSADPTVASATPAFAAALVAGRVHSSALDSNRSVTADVV